MNAEDILRNAILAAIRSGAASPSMNAEEQRELADSSIETFKWGVQEYCQQLDGKRNGLVWHRKDGRVTEGFFILIPEDRCSVRLLQEYEKLCKNCGCGPEQIAGVNRVWDRFIAWQNENENQSKIKTPDLRPDDNAQ